MLMLSGLAAAAQDGRSQIADPLEPVNRAMHGVNLALDQAVLRPASRVYAETPQPFRTGVRNVVDTYGLPADTLNAALQGDAEGAVLNVSRLIVNLSFGILGIFDAADDFGLPHREADFAETLQVWGIGNGVYLELPVLGPGTARDGVGRIVDIVIDPLGQVTAVTETGRVALALGDVVDERTTYADVIEALLYESADSYAATRNAIAQQANRSGHRDAPTEDDFIDIYAE
ncbi:MAG: MlaA family lipoprotein [Rubricella sp.]